jgi:ABC-2 type transport system permease protein
MMQVAGLAVGGYVVALVLRLHRDEAEGTLEPVLATGVSRIRWLAAYGINALASAVLLLAVFAVAMAVTGGLVLGGTGALLGDLLIAALVQLPAIGALGAAVAVVVLLVPRWSVGLSWLLMVGSVVLGPMFGPALGLPGWVRDLSPFTHVPNAPAVAVTVGPLLGPLVVGVLLGGLAVLQLRRRDLALPA